jgi:hypothetical protein
MRHQKLDITEGMLSLDKGDVVSEVVIVLHQAVIKVLVHVHTSKEQLM